MSQQYNVSGTADFNGDGKLDLFVTETEAGTGHPEASGIQLGNGDGTFGPFLQIPTSGLLWSSFYADMNGDGHTDIVFLWDLAGSEPFRVNGLGVILNTTQTGFELFASALSPSSVTAGNSATTTINALANFGFNTAETLSCSGLPSGAVCAFNPPSIAGGAGKSALTITAGATTAAGTYPIQVTGTAGAVTSSTSLSLIVLAAPDFSFGPTPGSPTSQTITAGQTANFSLDLAPSAGFSGTVNFSCAITPLVNTAPTCNVPPSAQISGTGTQSISTTVSTTASVTTSVLADFRYPPANLRLLWLGAIFVSVSLCTRTRGRISAFSFAIVVVGAISLFACGGSSSPSHITIGTPAGTYTVTVSASSGNTKHNTTLQVIVQ